MNIEVTNDSKLPLRMCDAKLLHMHEWKKEKERLIEERNKIIMERLNIKMKQSSLNRNQNLIEDVQMKAHAMCGDHLKVLEKKNLSLRKIDDYLASNFMSEISRRKEAEILRLTSHKLQTTE